MQLNALCKNEPNSVFIKLLLTPLEVIGLTRKTLLCMKITAFLLLAFCLQVSASTMAQNITLSEHKAPLEKVLNEIKQQSGYVFFYNQEWMKQAHPVDVDLKNQPLEEVLKACFLNQPYTYEIVNKTIVLKLKEKPVAKKEAEVPVTVTGKVLDEQGQPLPGVTIRIKGTSNGTVTDAKGAYIIVVPDNNTVLAFSFIGYETQELQVKYISVNSVITLKASSTNLKEVVVDKGYYTTTEELNTGSVSSISAKEIAEQPVNNVLEAMEGRIPGLFVTQSSGNANGSFTIKIRGQNSIANGNDPFYVVDGVPYTSQLINGTNPYGGNPLNFINPNDIENIEVLKDADATSIYGSRGANGVILITTKKGKAGRTIVDANVSQGIGRVNHFMDLLNTTQYLQMRREAFKNDGVTPTVANAPDLLLWDTTRNANWQKILAGGTSHYTDAQTTISGGNENTQFLVGATYHRETYVSPGDFSDQHAAVHFSINSSSANKKFKFLFTGSYLYDNNNVPAGGVSVQTLLFLPPNQPNSVNPDGSYNWALNSSGRSTLPNGNPFAKLSQIYQASTNNLISNAVLSYQIFQGLDFKTSIGYTNTQLNERGGLPLEAISPNSYNGTTFATFNYNNIHAWIIEPQLNFQRKIGPGTFNALIGGTIQGNYLDGLSFFASGYTSDAQLSNISAATSLSPSTTNSTYKYNALYARLSYNILDKYVLNLTANRDGSSRFGPGRQFGNFGAGGLAWIFSKEKFFEDNFSFLSFGKLRTSYGVTGNDQIGDYRFLDLYVNGAYPSYAGVSAIYPNSLFNSNLAWEINKKIEGAIDLGFINNRILFSASYYRNRSSNQLVNAPLPSITGFTGISENLPATVQNKGWEFTLTTTNIKNDGFTWNSSINLTTNRNKLIAYPGLTTSNYKNTLIIGQPISIAKVLQFAGVNSTTGQYEFKTASGSLSSSPNFQNDAISTEDLTPKYYGGLQNSFRYKNIQLDFFFQFVKQTGRTLESLVPVPPGTFGFNNPVSVLGRWQTPGDISTVQPFTENYKNYSGFSYKNNSTAAYTDNSYIRLKNVSLSYLLPKLWNQKLHLQNLNIYFQGQNLLTFTSYHGWDPETVAGLPPLQMFTLGLHGTF
ncbi:MAG: TonB-dependent receptor plug [Chitinophagaceae bacterium]|nr:TonB-dependent receptor plug [Chitinophagaceae bacterium]